MAHRNKYPGENGEETFELKENKNSSKTDDHSAGSCSRKTILLILVVFIILFLIVFAALLYFALSKESLESQTCGANKKEFKRTIDHSEPEKPGPFHDLTKNEVTKLFKFLEEDPKTNITPSDKATSFDSYVYMMDLYPAKKADVLTYLDGKGNQPDRQARAILFRGDLKPPLVEEYICGPLPNIQKCELLKSNSRRNPVDYALRPIGHPVEMNSFGPLLQKIDKEIGYILRESYGMSYANCGKQGCLNFFPAPIGSSIVGTNLNRYMWFCAMYPIEYYAEYNLNFLVLANLGDVDPEKHSISKIWYNGQFFESVEDFIKQYNSSSIEKTKIRPPKLASMKDSISSLYQTGDPVPDVPQRPPTLIEPDGKRYSIKNKQVEYMGWKFNFRMSSMSGPSVSNVRFRGDRIAYELSLQEVAAIYSSENPQQRVTDYMDSAVMLGMQCRTLIPGADCPNTATFIPQTFAALSGSEPLVVKHGFCVFENNYGYPLRRHSSYTQYEGGYYGGMLNSALVVRSILTVFNYDYVVDFVFYQSGAVQTQVLSTGYILPMFKREEEKNHGFQIQENIMGPIHHHMFNFKVDLDISGTSNRYETLDIKEETVSLRFPKDHKVSQTKFDRSLKSTEKDALYKFNFDTPKYHLVHNEAKKTAYGAPKAYRIHFAGMSKNLIKENDNNEKTMSWSRHQLVVTKHKDEELTSSSHYSMYDSLNPVVNFTQYYDDDESIVDEDLVFWLTIGTHHIPHSEDLPITPTVGGELKFFLLPYNYFPKCPSFHSRDHVRIDMKDKHDIKAGLNIFRHGYEDQSCEIPKYADNFDELLRKEPDVAVETNPSYGHEH